MTIPKWNESNGDAIAGVSVFDEKKNERQRKENGSRDETKSFEEFAKRLFEKPKEETEVDETS